MLGGAGCAQRRNLIVGVFWLLILVPFPALAEKRVALVIGNSAYKYAGTLDNPRNDATDMAAALKKVGFEIIEGFDLDKARTDRKVRDFATALQGANVGLFYYAGHGLQVSGQNYIVPIDAELNTAAALDFEMVRLDLVQRTMEREAQTNILFLDACRNNPLARNLARAMGTRSLEIGRGLAPVESGVGTLISFSTQPGNVALDGTGRNSPFAGALAKRIVSSRDDLSALLIDVRNDVMKQTQNTQIPWEHSALTGRFYFSEPLAAPVSAAAPSLPTKSNEAAEAWAAVKDSSSVAVLESFLERYKDTMFADFARARAGELKIQQAKADLEAQAKIKADTDARARAETDGQRAKEEAERRATEEARRLASRQLEPEHRSTIVIYRIASGVSQGIHNMRSGPGVGHSLIVSIPANSTGVSVDTDSCRSPDDGRSTQQWCKAVWRGYSGWVSMGGLVR
jgi:uncharacterized caspase-like protein